MFNVFKITYAGVNRDGHDLLGLLVAETTQGYFLVDPEYMLEKPRIMSTSLKINGRPHFNFPFKERSWTLHIDSVSPTEISGTWFYPGIDYDVEDNWTATSSGGGTGVPDDDEARAASAK